MPDRPPWVPAFAGTTEVIPAHCRFRENEVPKSDIRQFTQRDTRCRRLSVHRSIRAASGRTRSGHPRSGSRWGLRGRKPLEYPQQVQPEGLHRSGVKIRASSAALDPSLMHRKNAPPSAALHPGDSIPGSLTRLRRDPHFAEGTGRSRLAGPRRRGRAEGDDRCFRRKAARYCASRC
jgi:hypothetical protein